MADDIGSVSSFGSAPADDLSMPTVGGRPQILSETSKQTLGKIATYGFPALVAGLADTMGQSIGLLGDDDVQSFLQHVAPGGLGDFYARDRTAIRTTAEIAGIFLPGAIGLKLLKSARLWRETGKLGSYLKNSTAANVLLGSSTTLTAAEARISADALKFGVKQRGFYAGKSFAVPEVEAAKRAYFTSRVVEGVRQSVAMEAAYKVLYNDSEVFYPADYSMVDQVKWGIAGAAVGGGIELAIGKLAARKILQGVARDADPITEFGSDLTKLVFRPGTRGVGMSRVAIEDASIAEIIKNSSGSALGTHLQQDRTVFRDILATQVKESASSDSHPFVPKAQFALGDPKGTVKEGQIDLALGALKQNPTLFLYATKLGNVPEEGAHAFYTGIGTKVQAAKDHLDATLFTLPTKIKDPVARIAAAKKAREEADFVIDAADESHFVIESTGELSAFSNRADNWLDQNGFGSIKRESFKDTILEDITGKYKDISRSSFSVGGIKLFDDFTTEGMTAGATPADWSKLYAASSKFISQWAPKIGHTLSLTEKSSRFQIEGALELIKAKPEAAAGIKFEGAFAGSQEKAEWHVLNDKYKEFTKLMARTERKPRNAFEARIMSSNTLDPSEIFQQLNLPQSVGLAPHPLVETFAQAHLQGAKTLTEIFDAGPRVLTGRVDPMALFQANMREAMGEADGKVTYAISGKLFQQKDIRPVFVASKGVPTLAYSDKQIHAMIELRLENAIRRIAEIDPTAAPLISKVANDLAGNGAMVAAKDVGSLNEGIASGRGVVVYQDRINEQMEALKAAMLVAQKSDRIIFTHVQEVVDSVLTPIAAHLKHGKNRVDLIDFNRGEQSYRHGWEISGIEKAPNGSSMFVLTKDSPKNKQLLEYHFGDKDVSDVTHMPDMSITARKVEDEVIPLQVSSYAAGALHSISKLSLGSGVENNALRVALGYAPIKLREFHLPTPELGRQGSYFVRNPNGTVVGTFTSGTANQNKAAAIAAAQDLSKLRGGTHIAIPLEDVRRSHNIGDNVFLDVIDYSDQLAKTGVGIKGSFAHTQIDTTTQTLDAMITSLNEQYLSVGIRGRAALFEPQLNYAAHASELTGKSVGEEANIFDRYQAIIFSRSPTTPTGTLTRLYGSIENGLDKGLSVAHGMYSEMIAHTPAGQAGARSLTDIARRRTSKEEFRQYREAAKAYSPFETTQEWLESTHPEIPKWQARNALAKTAMVSATMSLRILDVGTAMLNLTGVLTTMPAIVSSMRRMSGEGGADHLFRTAAWGSKASSAEIATFSPSRAIATVFQRYWKGELAAPMADAARKGYFDPEWAQIAKVLTDPKAGGKGKFEEWIDGASWLADKSDVLSRKMAWGMGYSIGKDLHKFENEENLYIYANNFMNEMIGNYNPRNKPGMFQGAIGLPLGAFQTYMFNYYRRMYGYLERKDWISLAAGYGAQASVFGAGSVPGWQAYNSFLFNTYDGSDNLTTRLDRKLPAGVADLLLHGSLSNIPKVFGQGGIAFYTRGSVDWTRMPATVEDITRAPPIQFLATVADGFRRTVDNVVGAGGWSLQQQEQILANMSTNRAIKSVMELAANVKVDLRGQAIDYGTRDAIHLAAAALGSVPSSTRDLQDSYNREQAVQLTQENARAKLTDHTRALFRGGEFEVSDLQPLIQSYIRSGGNPAYFGNWLRNTSESATTPKALKKLKELATSGRFMEFMNMLSVLQQNDPSMTVAPNGR